MSLVALIGQMLESGKITLSSKNKEDIEITAVNKRIDVNTKNKQFVKDLVASLREGSKNIGIAETLKEGPEMLKAARNMRGVVIEIANELKDAGVTVTLSYKGDVVATVGAQASSKIGRLVTGTKAIQINSLPKLIELGI